MDKLPRAAKSWKFVFLTTLIRRDVRPRGLSLQGTIPSLSSMVFSCPGGALFEGNLLAKRCGKQLRAAEVANRCKTLLPRAVKSWTLCSLMFLTKVSEWTLRPVDYHCKAPFVLQFHGVFPSRRLVSSSISSSPSRHTKSSWCFPVREVRFFKAIC